MHVVELTTADHFDYMSVIEHIKEGFREISNNLPVLVAISCKCCHERILLSLKSELVTSVVTI